MSRDAAAVTPMAFARAIVTAYERAGRSPAEALKLARIAPASLNRPQTRLTARAFETLSAAAMQELDDEALGAFERRLPWGSYGMLARASLSSPTLGVALQRWCRHHGLLTGSIALGLASADGLASLSVQEHGTASGEVRELNLAFVLRNVHGLACWYIDSRIALHDADFPFPAPAHADAYPHMFPGGEVRFGAPLARIRFDARYLALPLRRDERALRLMLQRALSITVLQYRKDRLLVEQVRQALHAHPDRSRSATGLASLLHVSPRTLHRQLKEEGASLQALKDDVRRERAQELLLRSGKPLKQVAALVGFRNEKSFTRAFRAWTGRTPGAFRAAE
ncbi:AraC family transcriptional regulator [Ramlibacter sp.]|uniref:AraC family transcriptional regulator n=1 Tax=Ramlibacter sp. TaxID=1917967 RepID=UPI003D0F2C41